MYKPHLVQFLRLRFQPAHVHSHLCILIFKLLDSEGRHREIQLEMDKITELQETPLHNIIPMYSIAEKHGCHD